MKKIVIAASILFTALFTGAQDLSYYLPDSVTYNPAIPKPKEVIYHEVGEWHVTHDRLVNYMQAIARAAPNRVKMEIMGFTYEDRPQLLLIFTSKKNLDNLEQIRQQHLAVSDPAKSASINIDNMPIVVYIGHSIHGNEPSGANASLLTAYYLAAAQGKQIDDLLDNTIILFDPSLNPDGLQRFSTWANQHRSKNLVTDPASREFNEVWPGGRFNHYWFDLNRDWLPAVHRESQHRLEWYHRWNPNILTDHHEQGSNATFFFQPGVPSRVNPLTPAKNQELTAKLGEYHAAFLDRIGSLYFTKENYDDFYYGKGSTYPDVNGAIGILFEQASSRGHAQQTANGILRFPFTIKNQFTTALSTLEGAKALRKEFLDYQREFYQTAIKEAGDASVKAYVFGSRNDEARSFHFVEMLRRHGIEVYRPASTIKANTGNGIRNFETSSAYVVPAAQPQFRLIEAIFQKTHDYKDSLFYDITAWTLPLAFGLSESELNGSQFSSSMLGEKVINPVFPKGSVDSKSNYAYLLDWGSYYAPAALYEMQDAGLITKVATRPLEAGTGSGARKFDYGTIMVAVHEQRQSSDSIYALLSRLASKYGVHFYGVRSGNVSSGSDLGSRYFNVVEQPKIAMIAGPGVSATDAGEVWHLLDQRFNMPPVLLEPSAFNRTDADKYNTILMVGGSYGDLNKDKLKSWVQGGGNLVLTEEAVSWAAQNGISNVSLKRAKSPSDSGGRMAYVDREQVEGAQQMSGAIFGARADLTHPLAYGYKDPVISLFKANRVYMEKSKNPFASPFVYTSDPLQSGWVSRENLSAVKGSAAVIVNAVGSGRVINIADNPNFRAFWMGGTKLMMNAIFFGKTIDAGSARVE